MRKRYLFFKRETLPENKASYGRQADEKHNPYLLRLWIHAHHTCPSPRVWGGRAQVTRGVQSSRLLQNWVTRCLGTHGEAATALSPQSPREVGAAVWLVGGDVGFQDLLWERQGRELQPLPSILFNLIPRANPKWVPTEPCHLGFYNAPLAICHGKQPSELQMTGIFEATHIFSPALCLSSCMLLMHLKNCNKFGFGGGLVKGNNTILDTKMTYWDL